MRLVRVEKRADLQEFWLMFGPYIHELIDDEEDLEYFLGDEYRATVEGLMTRAGAPLNILFMLDAGEVTGFLTYIQYESEKKCFILEYCVLPEFRGEGRGQRAYRLFEEMIGGSSDFFELTPGNSDAEGFWLRQGYAPAEGRDEDGKRYYRKYINKGESDAEIS